MAAGLRKAEQRSLYVGGDRGGVRGRSRQRDHPEHAQIGNEGPDASASAHQLKIGPTAALSSSERCMPSDHLSQGISVRGTEIRSTEARHRYREKIARVTQLIAVTGYGQEIERQRTTHAGFRHHLTKPVDISTLERALNSAYGDDVQPS